MSKITEKQREFLNLYLGFIEEGVDPKPAGKKAKELAGYAESVTAKQVIEALPAEELRKIYNLRLLEVAPVAIEKLFSVMQSGARTGAKTELAAAESILDRIGLAKKSAVEVDITPAAGIIYLPAKQAEKEEE